MSWEDLAACGNTDPETFFPTLGAAQERIEAAQTVCRRCEVRAACLQAALDLDEWEGVWGGLTVKERRTIPPGAPIAVMVMAPADLWRRLNEARQRRGLRWFEVSAEVGISPSGLSAMRNGQRPRSDAMARAYAWTEQADREEVAA